MNRKHKNLTILSIFISLMLVFSILSTESFASKKGLQGIESANLMTKHSLYNLIITEYINTSGGTGYESLGTYTSGGSTRTYYLNVLGLSQVGEQFRTAKQKSELETISVVLLARKMAGITYSGGGASPYFAFDTWSDQGVKLNTKLMNLIGQCLGGSAEYFIMQNEVNNPDSWMEMGKCSSIDEYVLYYEKACRLLNNGLKASGSQAKVMVSLDYYWNSTDGNRYNSKDLITKFAAKAKAGGDYDWGLAHHTYPVPLTEPSFTDDGSLGLKHDESTNFISLINLDVLTNYFKKSEMLYNNTVRDIIISEAGFNAYNKGKIDEETQAAMYAYAYYKIETIPEIKAFIIRANVDLSPEPEMGLYFGMYDQNWNPREIRDLMKYIDTKQGSLLTKKYLRYFKVSSWDELVPGFSSLNFSQSKFAVGLDNDYGTALGAGQSVAWTAEASGGKEPYQYRFVFLDSKYNETVMQDYSADNTMKSGLPLTSDAHIRVDVKDAAGSVT